MLSRDTVKRRLAEGDGMSFAEFTYPLMQSWDWWHLYASQGVQMQIGGSDQYGNIVLGAEGVKAIRASEPDPKKKMPDGPLSDPIGFTVPLLTDSSGAKFGKSAGNAVWLDQHMTTTFDLYGYFVRRSDEEVETLLKLFTFMPSDDIHKLIAVHRADPPKRVAQHTLAYEVLCLIHGPEVARRTQDEHRAMYGKTAARSGAAAAETSADEYVAVEGHPTTLNNAPRVDLKLPESLIRQGKIASILYAARMVPSKSEGQRLAIQKGVYVGASPGQKSATNKGMSLDQLDFTPVSLWFPEDTKNFVIDDKYIILRKGKHNVRIIEVVSDDEWRASGATYPGEPGKGQLRQLREKIKALRRELGMDDDPRSQETIVAEEPAGEQEHDAGEGVLHFPEQKSASLLRAEEELQRLRELKQEGKDA